MKIKQLNIKRMPGFPQGLKGVSRFADNINIIAGPNGSGKSSTARVIQKLIWWKDYTGYEVDARVNVGEQPNQIQIDARSYTRITPDERTHEDFSFISPSEFSGQYMLALHDLVRDNDENLAEIISKEVNGGIDLNKASSELSYKDIKPNAGHQAYKEYQSAQELYRKLDSEQASLKREEDNLQILKKEKATASKALHLKELYQKTIHVMDARKKHSIMKEQFEQYPERMQALRKDDYDVIVRTEQKINEIDATISQAEKTIDDCKQKMQSLHIKPENVSDTYTKELSARIEVLRNTSRNIQQLEKEVSKQKVSIANSSKAIQSDELSSLAQVTLREMNELGEFIRLANEESGRNKDIRSEKERLLKEMDAAGELSGNGETAADPYRLRRAIDILSEWLKTTSSQPEQKKSYYWLMPVIGVLSALLAFLGGLYGLLAGVLISIASIFIIRFLTNKAKEEKDPKPELLITEYQKQGLTPPASWDSISVSQRLDEIINELQCSSLLESLEKRLQMVENELMSSDNKLQNIHQEYDNYRKLIGALPEELSKLTSNYNSFYLFVCHIIKYQEAINEVEKMADEMATLQHEYEVELGLCNSIIAGFNYPAATDHIQADAIYQDIIREKQIVSDCVNQMNIQTSLIEQKKIEKGHFISNLNEVYSRLEVTVGDKNEVYTLIRNYDDYISAREKEKQSATLLNQAEHELKVHPLFGEYEQQISILTADEVKVLVSENTVLAETLEETIRKITQTETLIAKRKEENNIELALSRREEALFGLEKLFDSNLKSVTGHLIVSQLRNEISLNNDNKVFKQANRILGSITKGRYNLTLEDSDKPSFRAFDNILNISQLLTEISTGTRVQLLLAIRLAYIETQENSIRLPLLADELLANSDDMRTDAIIQSLIEISKHRQLFYFTAQADEVRKWKQYIDKEVGLSSEIIQLGNKIIEYDDAEVQINPIVLSYDVVAPGTMSHAEYGKKLAVKTFNLTEQNTAELHLWYLLEDVHVLHHCLIQGYVQWGQLNSYLENGGTIPGIDDDTHQSLRMKIQLLEKFKMIYSHGRQRKINREVLINSGAVSDKYLDKMTELLIQKNYEPDRLLLSLETGEIKGFRGNKKEELRTYLIENNYLSEEVPYNEEEIRIRIDAVISNIGISRNDAERFLDLLWSDK